MKEIVAFILIKTHSRRLPNKNFMEIDGKPLWLHTAQMAVASPEIKHTVLVTDKHTVLIPPNYSLDTDKVTVIQRPKRLMENGTTSEAVLLWAVREYEWNNTLTDILLLQASCPTIDNARLNDVLLWYPRCDVENFVSINPYTCEGDGQIYLISKDLLFEKESLLTEKLFVNDPAKMTMNNYVNIDIDYLSDYMIAKAILEGRTI